MKMSKLFEVKKPVFSLEVFPPKKMQAELKQYMKL